MWSWFSSSVHRERDGIVGPELAWPAYLEGPVFGASISQCLEKELASQSIRSLEKTSPLQDSRVLLIQLVQFHFGATTGLASTVSLARFY